MNRDREIAGNCAADPLGLVPGLQTPKTARKTKNIHPRQGAGIAVKLFGGEGGLRNRGLDMAPELRIEMRVEASALISEKFRGWVSLIGKRNRPRRSIPRTGILKMDSPGRGTCTRDPKLLFRGHQGPGNA